MVGDYKAEMDPPIVHSLFEEFAATKTKLIRNLKLGGRYKWHITNKI